MKPGRKPGYFKPMALTAKGALKVLVMHHNEKEYSAADLAAETTKMVDIAKRFKRFLDGHGLRVSFVETVP